MKNVNVYSNTIHGISNGGFISIENFYSLDSTFTLDNGTFTNLYSNMKGQLIYANNVNITMKIIDTTVICNNDISPDLGGGAIYYASSNDNYIGVTITDT